nr:Holliday junction branch migration protein RuvA [Halorhodospira halochloris]
MHGRLIEKHPPILVLDVNGVGYEVNAPLSTLESLPESGSEVTIYTHLSVREDGQALFGFRSRNERELFRRLIRVSGVGPKMALALLSGVDGNELVRCVNEDDPKRLTAVPGVGRKTAERLIVELRDRLEGCGFAVNPPGTGASSASGERDDGGASGGSVGEAIDGLVALGYKPGEAARMARTAAEPGMSCEAILRRALQRAVPAGG